MINIKSILSIGFRPFFLLAALIAILNPTLWVSTYSGHIDFSPYGSTLFWHSHEMVFGFTSALIAGFLLTASANWTGTRPYSGFPLLLLILLWSIERFSFFFALNDTIFIFFSNLFLPTFLIFMTVKLYKFPAQKYVFLPFILSLALAKFLHIYGFLNSIDQVEAISLGSGVGLIRLLLFLLAGRVVPFFSKMKLDLPEFSIPKHAHLMALIPIVILIFPLSNYKILYTVILCLAIIGNLYRNYLMFLKATLKVPMLWILHLGLSFLVLGLILELLSLYFPVFNSNKEALHTTMAGGLGLISIGIMSRVSLGHTGRIIKATLPMTLAFISVALGALIRGIFPLIFPDHYDASLHYASGFWTLGFLYFLIKFTKILCTPRHD